MALVTYSNVGTIKRAKPVLQILRGNQTGESSMLSAAYPVAADVSILSGMVVTPSWNNDHYEWVLGASDKGAYFATVDGNDYDVIAAGKLVGLSSTGTYELASGYFKDTETYEVGTLLTAGTDGLLKPAVAEDVVIGRVTRDLPSAAAVTTGIENYAGNTAAAEGYAVDSGAEDPVVLVFETVAPYNKPAA